VIFVAQNDLVENGGRYSFSGRTVYPIAVVDKNKARCVGGGPIFVHEVTVADIVSGKYRLIGGSAMKVVDVTDYDEQNEAGEEQENDEEIPPLPPGDCACISFALVCVGAVILMVTLLLR